jgi:hypothetical protein
MQTSVSDMSASMKEVRSRMEQDEQLKVLMAGFRGSNLDESDFASANVTMRLVSEAQDDSLDAALPLSYDPDAINRWGWVGGWVFFGGLAGVAVWWQRVCLPCSTQCELGTALLKRCCPPTNPHAHTRMCNTCRAMHTRAGTGTRAQRPC